MIHHHEHSLFQRLLLTLIMLVILIALIFVGAVFSSNALRDLKQSSFDLFDQRVVYRANELQKLLARDVYKRQAWDRSTDVSPPSNKADPYSM